MPAFMSAATSAQVHLGNAIQKLRKQKGLSQEALAFECELHRTYIGSVERGERNISLQNLIRLAHALGINPSDLLKRAGL